MEWLGGFEGLSETEAEKTDNSIEFDDKILDKYDKIFGDDKIEEKNISSDSSKGALSPNERKEKYCKLFDFGDMFKGTDKMTAIGGQEPDMQDTDLDQNTTPDLSRTRELTDDEKQLLKDKLGWSDEKIEQKCRIYEDGVINFKCRTEKENDSGVEYVTETIEINGIEIEVTVPDFESIFDTELSEEYYESSNTKQFAECNKKLKESIEEEPKLRMQFSSEQLEDIENGDTPRGYTWHHNAEPGKMQLVRTEEHDQCVGGAPHTGGNSLWGNKAHEKKQEGEKF